ncbi:putative dead box rna helicase protein [Phaeoacremonium minimum UCRPA7]|uniref:ATP-dependent RNA helicase n=1 Tax=Phaeoacremonium minimum (strain UCR-PA7) TaxID=1286976 RepID=R8BX41_PHAM7|nr:putative dead box rna helicase protein [Phaeoacremonium minimum UCRPA7]EOO03895.1 putative dead box rna helicase protein [Phaeoacremonium minimum UCRPA7]
MFKRTLARQAGLCSARRVASPALLRSSIRLQTKPVNRIASISRISAYTPLAVRSYSSATAEQVEQDVGAPSGPITRFADLESLGVHDTLLKAITQDMGYETMTDVQSMTIAPGLAGKDIVAQAKTGTGKTLGFLLPVLQRMITEDERLADPRRGRARADDIRAIIVSPTRELAEQIGAEARNLCRHTGIRVQTAVGGTQKSAMLRKTRYDGCDLLVATPGRLYDVLSDDHSGIDAPMLRNLVLDEADRMLDVGFDKELREIINLLPDRSQVPRQTLLFSATIPKDVVQLARTYVDANNFQFVQTIKADDTPTHEKVPQHIVSVKGYENLFPTLLELVHRARSGEHGPEPFKAIVFFSTTAMVEVATEVFNVLYRTHKDLPPVFDIHSKKTQAQRTSAATHFRRATSAILLSSDVTARGMDFPNVSHVIQVGVPPSREQYIHRIGRTGRANKSGQGWLIVSEKDLPYARRELPGLPIKRHDGLESAEVHVAITDESALPEHVTRVNDAMKKISKDVLHHAYFASLSAMKNGDVQDTVDQLNDWVQHAWGWEEPPAMSAHTAKLRGLTRVRGLNIAQSSRDRRSGDDRRGDDRRGDDRRGDDRRGDDRRGGFRDDRRGRGGDRFDSLSNRFERRDNRYQQRSSF